MTATATATARRAPVWYIAHGGPPTLFQPDHPAFKHWVRVGQDMRQSDLSGLVVISAHWQADPPRANARTAAAVVQINTDPANPLLYDYYNFPPYFYKLALRSSNPPAFSSLVADALRGAGLGVEPTERGIDHGVFIPLKAAFHNVLPADSPHVVKTGVAQDEGRDALPEHIPLCQISLPAELLLTGREAAEAALHLGRALRPLRERGIGLMFGGQPVHNLRVAMRHFRSGVPPDARSGLYPAEDFARAFSEAISGAVVVGDGGSGGGAGGEKEREERVLGLVDHPAYKEAHPTDEHFLPLPAAIGATYDDEAVREDTAVPDGGMAWNMYRWG
ncbi:hypothetical protein OC842_005621 [Tilletia horrida]|uniref:Extradiol ring-cleavage dioxygenase class III enzyme subunit B domain-containing protein n=1 Tax=Tilletia horrida TaxID=155126 RepID=A0AAN6G7G7_9BASI|nr:hypothetical protein OC842_005621 [Tilletia horrida]